MMFPLSTPGELAEEPELALLVDPPLRGGSGPTHASPAQPDLASRGFLDEVSDVTPRLYIATSILGTLELLTETVDHYVFGGRQELIQLRLLG